MLSPSPQYDVVPIQPSVVICSCSHPSMVRNHPDSCSPLAIPGASSSHCPGMEGSVSEARAVGASSSNQDTDRHTQPPVEVQQPRKKKPDDFKFGKILGEGSFSTVTCYAIGFPPIDVATCYCFVRCTRMSHSPVVWVQVAEDFSRRGGFFSQVWQSLMLFFASVLRLCWQENIQLGKNTQVSDIAKRGQPSRGPSDF